MNLLILGPFLAGWLSNYKGRKPCFVCGGIFAIIANIILLFTNNLAMLYIGRLLSSCGVSIIVVINVVYIGEMALVQMVFVACVVHTYIKNQVNMKYFVSFH